jgi:hypothetical protein
MKPCKEYNFRCYLSLPKKEGTWSGARHSRVSSRKATLWRKGGQWLKTPSAHTSKACARMGYPYLTRRSRNQTGEDKSNVNRPNSKVGSFSNVFPARINKGRNTAGPKYSARNCQNPTTKVLNSPPYVPVKGKRGALRLLATSHCLFVTAFRAGVKKRAAEFRKAPNSALRCSPVTAPQPMPRRTQAWW